MSNQDLTFKNELLDLYATRITDFPNYSASCKTLLEKKQINLQQLKLTNFYDFSHWFAYIGKNLVPRPPPRKQYRNLRYYPNPPAYGRNAQYNLHCMFQMILYKPWQTDPNTLIEEKLTELRNEAANDEQFNEDKIRLICFKDAYRLFLEKEALNARQHFSAAIYANELKQASFAYHAWREEDREDHKAIDVEAQEIQNGEDWMCILHAVNIIQKSRNEILIINEHWDVDPYAKTPETIDCWRNFIETEVMEFKVQPRPDSTDDIKYGTDEQKLVYTIIMNHQQRALSDPTTDPLFLIVQGEAGTGKSWLLPILRRDLLRNSSYFCAVSARAACLIGGITVATLLSLPRGKKDTIIDGTRKTNLQERFEMNRNHLSATYIFLDERSLLGSRIFCEMNSRAQVATQCSKIFGGMSVILIGDICQLPPVQDSVVYERRPIKQVKAHIVNAYNLHLDFQ